MKVIPPHTSTACMTKTFRFLTDLNNYAETVLVFIGGYSEMLFSKARGCLCTYINGKRTKVPYISSTWLTFW